MSVEGLSALQAVAQQAAASALPKMPRLIVRVRFSFVIFDIPLSTHDVRREGAVG
jgi:hypothetical protein